MLTSIRFEQAIRALSRMLIIAFQAHRNNQIISNDKNLMTITVRKMAPHHRTRSPDEHFALVLDPSHKILYAHFNEHHNKHMHIPMKVNFISERCRCHAHFREDSKHCRSRKSLHSRRSNSNTLANPVIQKKRKIIISYYSI